MDGNRVCSIRRSNDCDFAAAFRNDAPFGNWSSTGRPDSFSRSGGGDRYELEYRCGRRKPPGNRADGFGAVVGSEFRISFGEHETHGGSAWTYGSAADRAVSCRERHLAAAAEDF